MRYGVLADVHANLHALDAALELLSDHGVERYLCAGDLVGYGPLPNECVRRVLALPGVCVAGNHDLIALDRLSDERCIPLARASLQWTRHALEDDARALLSRLPLGARTTGIAVYHGSVGDPREYVVSDAQARSCLQALEAVEPGASVLVLGHTHRPMAVARGGGWLLRGRTGEVRLPPDDPVVLNPGAVGQTRSRDPRARVMVLDDADRVATFHAVAYDVAGCRRALRERGLPQDSYRLPRSRRREVRSAVRRIRRLVRRSAS